MDCSVRLGNKKIKHISKFDIKCNWWCNKQFHWLIAFTLQSKIFILSCWKLLMGHHVNSICDSKTTLQIQYGYSPNRCVMNFILFCEIIHWTMWYFTVVYRNINTTLLVVYIQYDIETIVNYNWNRHDQLSMCSSTIHYYDNKSISILSHEILSQENPSYCVRE